MMETRLDLSAEAVPESVRPIRRRVAEIAQDAGAEPSQADEVGLCVGEAVANAVRHAYVDRPGDVAVLVQVDEDEHELVAMVRDRGKGMTARSDSDGFGLHIIETLSRDVAISSQPNRGTTVRMSFGIGA